MWRLIGGDVAVLGESWAWLINWKRTRPGILCSNLSFISMLLKLCKVVCAMLVNTTGK